MQIKGRNLKNETVLEIGKFAILWNCFEKEYCNNNCKAAVIREKANLIQIDIGTQAKFADVINKRRIKLGQSITEYITNGLHGENAHGSPETDMNTMCKFLEKCGDYDELVCGCLLVIRRIRNNMMHGLKAVSELDKQIELFRSANEVLESIRCRK